MTAREDFRAAVREGITYRSSDALAAVIYAAGDAYVSAALASLAEALEAEAEYGGQHVAVSAAFRRSARMARERAGSLPGAPATPALVSADSPPDGAAPKTALSASDPREFGLNADDLRTAADHLYDATDTRLERAEWAHDRQVRLGQVRSRLRSLADAIAEPQSGDAP